MSRTDGWVDGKLVMQSFKIWNCERMKLQSWFSTWSWFCSLNVPQYTVAWYEAEIPWGLGTCEWKRCQIGRHVSHFFVRVRIWFTSMNVLDHRMMLKSRMDLVTVNEIIVRMDDIVSQVCVRVWDLGQTHGVALRVQSSRSVRLTVSLDRLVGLRDVGRSDEICK